MLKHPSRASLNRYADGEARPAEIERLESHLRECRRCWQTIQFIRELGDYARAEQPPRPPFRLRARVLRNSGDAATILPVVDLQLPTRRRRTALLATIATSTLVVFASWQLLKPSDLRSDATDLQLVCQVASEDGARTDVSPTVPSFNGPMRRSALMR